MVVGLLIGLLLRLLLIVGLLIGLLLRLLLIVGLLIGLLLWLLLVVRLLIGLLLRLLLIVGLLIRLLLRLPIPLVVLTACFGRYHRRARVFVVFVADRSAVSVFLGHDVAPFAVMIRAHTMVRP